VLLPALFLFHLRLCPSGALGRQEERRTARRAAGKEFDAFVTTDRGLPYQQNLSLFDLAVVVLEGKSNSYEDLASLMDRTNAALGEVVSGEATRIRA
jgi:hypothetical protein